MSVNIFVCCHKDFDFQGITNPGFKIISDTPNLNWGQIMRTAAMSGYDYQIKILTKLLNKIIPGLISTHAEKIIDHCCPDEKVKKYLKRDKKIVYLHKINHKFYVKQKNS